MAGTQFEDDFYLYHPEDPSVKTLTLAFTAVPESEGARVIDYDGAYSTTGNVSGHTVNVSGENTRYWSVTGGEAQGNAASGNRVTVSGGEGKGSAGEGCPGSRGKGKGGPRESCQEGGERSR